MLQRLRPLSSVRLMSGVTRPASQQLTLNFADHRAIYQFKSSWDLLRSLIILRTCSINYFVDNSLTLMKAAQRVLGDRMFPLILRPTFYRQFVGGDSEQELLKTTEILTKSNLRLMVCPVQEEDVGESGGSDEKYDQNLDYIMKTAEIMANTQSETPNLQLKITAFVSADLVLRLSVLLRDLTLSMDLLVDALSSDGSIHLAVLSETENQQLTKGIHRINRLIESAINQGLKVLVDGEYTYMNPGISAIALAMMVRFNKNSCNVANTYQCYLKETLNTIKVQKDLIDRRGCHFGAKVVRGAYMERERKLAQTAGYPDPINDTYEATGQMYNNVIDFLLDESVTSKDVYVVVATHNESGAFHAVEGMRKRKLDPARGTFVFGQIYGMGEQLSMPLANAGFIVYKSVPYGPINEVLPYLSRRAAENRAVMAGARRERELLKSEMRRRFLTIFGMS